MKRKVLLYILSIACILSVLFGISACNEKFEIYVDGYTLQIEEDGSYSILKIPSEELEKTVWTCPEKVGDYPISHLSGRMRLVGMWGNPTVMDNLGRIRKLILPNCILSVGDLLRNVEVIVTEKPISEINMPLSKDIWYYAPQEDGIDLQYLTEENFVDNMVILPNEENTEATLLYAFGGKEVTIPETYRDVPITKIGACAFANEYFKNVNVCQNVKEIGKRAFYGLDIAQIELPDCLEKIDERAFENSNLVSIDFPESLLEIKEGAFVSTKLTSVTLPSSIVSFGNFVFENCEKLHSFDISRMNLTTLNPGTFANCDLTGELKFSDNLRTLGERCFAKAKFSSFTIPETVTKINEVAFQNCPNLTELFLPDNVVHYDASATDDCEKLEKIHFGMIGEFGWWYYRFPIMPALKEISVSENNECFTVIDGILYEKNKEYLYFCPMNLPVESLTVSCKKIAKYAFYKHNNLKEITIEEGCEDIENAAFQGCEKLEKVNLPTTLERIGVSAFYNCSAFTTINTENVKIFDNESFSHCASLENLSFDSATIIGQHAFSWCNFSKVKLNDKCEKVGFCAFAQNENLKTFEYNKNYTVLGEHVFNNTPLDKDEDSNKPVERYGCNRFFLIH